MRFGHIEIFSSDPLKAKDFYVDVLGFEVEEIQHDKFVWLRMNDTVILLRPGNNVNKAGEYSSSNSGFVFYTDDPEKTGNELIKRGLKFKGTDGPETCLTFTDPDGNWFQLVDPRH